MKQITIFLFAFLANTAIKAQNLLAIPDTLSGDTINLNLQTGTVNFFGGTPTNTMGVNGNLLGPTLILEKNNDVTINVTNQLGEPTTIHWHGLHVAPENDGGPHVIIQNGNTWSPSFKVRDWASTHWYHPHLHHFTNEHVQKGIAGFIISRDSTEATLNLPRKYGIDDFPLVVQTKAFDANNQIVVMSALDSTLMVNGTINPFVELPAQVVRLRVLNGSSERYYNFGFTANQTFYQIASDAGLLSAPVALTRLMLAPGERAEILIDLSTQNGQTIHLMSYGAELPNAIYGAAQPGMGAGQVIPNYTLNPLNGANFNVLQINVIAPTANPVTTIPSTLITHSPWQETQANLTRTFTFTPVNTGPTAIQGPFLINSATFNMNVINFESTQENIEVWQLTNSTPISHPFHLHGFPFYVLTINGATPPAHLQGRKDVINVPAGGGIVRFITKMEDFSHDSLPYMYHCHMLTHEDDGMMGHFLVKPQCLLSVTQQPIDTTATENQTVQFSVEASDINTNYQWQSDIGFGYNNLSNAGQYSGVNTPTLTVSNVTLSNDNQLFRCIIGTGSCKDTSNVAILNVTGVGIEELTTENPVLIYPNPVTNQLNLLTKGAKNSNYSITNYIGSTIKTGKLTSEKETIDINSFSSGVYFINIEEFGKTYKFFKR